MEYILAGIYNESLSQFKPIWSVRYKKRIFSHLISRDKFGDAIEITRGPSISLTRMDTVSPLCTDCLNILQRAKTFT